MMRFEPDAGVAVEFIPPRITPAPRVPTGSEVEDADEDEMDCLTRL